MAGDGTPSGGRQLTFADVFESRHDASFDRLKRTDLDAHAWVDSQAGWMSGSDRLFEAIAAEVPLAEHQRRIRGDWVAEPRLTAHWSAREPFFDLPVSVDHGRHALSRRYGVEFSAVGFALYRDGRDSVAWHGDRVARSDPDAIVAILSLGSPRRFLLRPMGGGESLSWDLNSGDLLVMGRCQTTWEHAIPKRARAGPRISVQFRHGEYTAPDASEVRSQ